MRGFLAGCACLAAFVGLLLLGTATSWFGLVAQDCTG
jgi:hypothetical protein